ncbi:MAG: GNAT family N-acetyltransferase [Candidatus Bathyarchaeota archaeon]|jgi:GNAT superfamily N-acetyltransferase
MKEIDLEVFHDLSLNINLDGKRVGFIDAWEDEAVDRGIWIEYLYVVKWLRDSGIGTEAMKKAITRWRELGFLVITLDDIHWEKPEGFWRRLGFQGEGKRKRLVIQDASWL